MIVYRYDSVQVHGGSCWQPMMGGKPTAFPTANTVGRLLYLYTESHNREYYSEIRRGHDLGS